MQSQFRYSAKKRSSLRLSLSKFKCSPKKKKGLQPDWSPVFVVEFTSGPWPILIANSNGGGGGGAIFVFNAKIGLKSAKNGVFCILFRPMGGGVSPPAPFCLRYCSSVGNCSPPLQHLDHIVRFGPWSFDQSRRKNDALALLPTFRDILTLPTWRETSHLGNPDVWDILTPNSKLSRFALLFLFLFFFCATIFSSKHLTLGCCDESITFSVNSQLYKGLFSKRWNTKSSKASCSFDI